MDTRKMTLFATIAAIALLAVGIGYAYTAMTTNQGNTVAPEYITITQSGDGEYTFASAQDASSKVYWDSDDFKTTDEFDEAGVAIQDPEVKAKYAYNPNLPYKTKYTFTDGNRVANLTISGDAYKGVQLGKTITLNATQAGSIADSIPVTISAVSGFTAPTGSEIIVIQVIVTGENPVYFKLVGSEFKTMDGNNLAVFNLPKDGESTTNYKSADVKVYCAYSAEPGYVLVESDRAAQTPSTSGAAPSSAPIADGKLTFTVNQAETNAA